MIDTDNPYASPQNSTSNLLQEKLGEPIYSRGQILCGTFFGGFFCAAMMFKKNFRVAGSDQANKFFYGFILGGLIVLAISIFIKFTIIGLFIGIGSLFISNYIYDKYYNKLDRLSRRNGSKNCSNWKAFGLIVLSFCIIFILAMIGGIIVALV